MTIGEKLAKGPRSSLIFAWVLGVLFHQGGTISTVLTATTVKPVSDAHNVSHEELAYVVDSTGSPVATIVPFNAWPLYIAGLVIGTIPVLPDAAATMDLYLRSLPYNFYGWFAICGTLLYASGLLPFVGSPMRNARTRARETGALDDTNAKPMMPASVQNRQVEDYSPALIDFLLPVGVLVGLAIVPFVLNGTNWINEAFLACTLSAVAVTLARGMKTTDVLDGFIEGCQSMTIGAVILGLAVTMGLVAKEIGTATYVVAQLGDAFPVIALPGTLTALCMLVAFATGTSWGTYAVVFPIAMPLAWALLPDPRYLQVCFGAVLGGAVFGDQCSPISDTTILSAMFSGCDLMDHVRTQLPLALSVAALAVGASSFAAMMIQ